MQGRIRICLWQQRTRQVEPYAKRWTMLDSIVNRNAKIAIRMATLGATGSATEVWTDWGGDNVVDEIRESFQAGMSQALASVLNVGTQDA